MAEIDFNKLLKKILIVMLYLLLHFLALRYYLLNEGVVGLNWDWGIPYLQKTMGLSFKRATNLFAEVNWGIFQGSTSPPQAFLYLLGTILNLNGESLSKIYLFLSNALASMTFYLFFSDYLSANSKDVRQKNTALVSFFAGLLYGFSPSIFYTTLAGSASVRFAFVLLPLLFLAYYRLIRQPNKQRFLLFSLIFGLLVLISSQNATLFLIIATLHLSFCISVRKLSMRVGSILLLTLIALYLISIVLFNFPTILLMQQNSSFSSAMSAKTQPIFYEAQRIPYSFLSMDLAHRLIPVIAMPFGFQFANIIYAAGLISFSFILLSLLMSSSKKLPNLKYEILFWSITYLLLVSFSVGRGILGDLMGYIYTIPLMAFLRTPSYFSNIMITGITILTSLYLNYAVSSNLENSKKLIIALPSLLVALTFILPWVSGDLGLQNKINISDAKLGLSSLDEGDINALNILRNESYPWVYTLAFPSTGIIVIRVGNVSYLSPNVFVRDISTEILVLDDIHKDDEMYKFAEGIRESLNGTYDKNHEIFQRGGVKYILIANASYDNPVKSQEMELITAYLSNLSSKKVIERVAEGKFLTLYRLNVSPLIPDRIEYTRCNNNSTKLNDIYKEIEMYPQIGKAILVCENKTNAVELDSYQILKIVEESPSEYYLDVSTKGKKIAVYLPFRYDPAWKLEITNGKHGSIYHYRTMENMNLWLVEFEELPDLLSLKVKYVTELQNLNDLILMISGLIFAGYLIYLAYNLIKEE